ncbi:MAG: DUF3794 domain-containing protein, partial [Clostridia bacterium]|nr:DUF3794 domain-containing protein [Clostridia bacterium]
MSLIEKRQTHTLLKRALQETQYARVRGEVELPEGGISRVLSVQGLIVCEQTELLSDSAELSGVARFNVLYADGEQQPGCMTMQTQWQNRMDVPGCTPHMAARVSCVLQEAEAVVEGGLLRLDAVAALTLTADNQEAVTLLEGLAAQEEKLPLQTLPTQFAGQ